jgi:hypothetical protein
VLLAVVARSRRTTPAPQPSIDSEAYEADPAARATCVHLRPIEDEAREQGVRCMLDAGPPPAVWVDALDPEPAAMAPLRLASCVRHEESKVVGPHTFSDPVYRCTRCGSAIAFHQGGYGNDPPPLNIRPRPPR